MAGKKSKYELEIMIAGETDRSLGASIKRARKEIDSLEKYAGLSAQKIGDSFGGMSVKGIDSLGKVADRVFGTVVKGSQMAAAGTAGLLGASTMLGMGFESQMSTVQAISQASGSDMQRLTALAKKMGETTQFTAEEAGQGLEYMASAGWTTQQMLDGLPGVMYLAAASGEDLALSSEIVTGALTAFGKGADEAVRFADVLAEAAAASNTDVAGLGGTLEYVAPVAGALKYSYEDVAIAAGLMANANIKGEKAGTALRATLTNLAKPTNQMQGYMDALSLSLTDSNGKILSLRELLGDAREGFSKLSEAQKAEYAAGIAGKEGMSALLAIVNASQEDFNKLAEAIDHSTGAAQEMSKVRLDNLKGDLTILSSAAEGLGIEAYGGFSEELRELTQGATEGIEDLTVYLKENIPTIRREVKAFGEDIAAGLSPVMAFGEWSLDHPNVIKGTLMGITAALGTFKGVQTYKNGVALLGKLSGMISAWPVAVAGLAIGGIVGIGTAIQSAYKEAAKANLAEHFGDIKLSMEELDEVARHVVSGGSSLFNEIDVFEETSDKVQEFKESLNQSLKEIKKTEWKFSMGIELDTNDTQSYVSSVESFVKDAQEYITNSGYELKMAVDIVFGEDDPYGSGILEDSDTFYQSLYQRLIPLQDSLNEVLTDITENGFDLPKQQIVDGYLKEISEITSLITEAENTAKMQMIKNQYAGADLLDADTFQNLQQSIQEYTDQANSGVDASYQKILTSLNAQRIAGEKGMEGGISQEEFDTKSNEALQGYYEQKADIIQNGYQIMRDSIMSLYGDEIGPALDAVNQNIQEELPQTLEDNQNPEWLKMSFDRMITEAANANGMSRDSRDAVKLLMEGMLPTQEDFEQLQQQMEASGLSPAAVIEESLYDMASMKAVTGDEQSIWKLIGDAIANNEDYALLTATIQQQTGMVPDVVMKAIEEKNGDVRAAAQDVLNTIKATFEEGVSVSVPITLDTITRYRSGAYGNNPEPIEHYASGGLIESPTLSWFAEKSPEMAIPIDGSKRSLGLWRQAGELLGAYNQNNYGRMAGELNAAGAASQSQTQAVSAAPVFSPVIHVQAGENVKDQVMEGLSVSYEQFVEYMERFRREQYRQAF